MRIEYTRRKNIYLDLNEMISTRSLLMGIEFQLIPAINVDDEMDNQDDEDHEEFLLKKNKVI